MPKLTAVTFPSSTQPVALGREHDVVGAQALRARSRTAARSALGGGEPLAQRRARGVDLDERTRLGIDQREVADGGQVHLARVADLDRVHGVAGAQRAERAHPASAPRKSEMTTTKPGWRAMRPVFDERVGERVRVVVAVLGDALAERDGSARARRGRRAAASLREPAAPQVTQRDPAAAAERRGDRSRAPRPRRRRTSGGRRCRTPSTAETSSSSHVVSTRSGTCSRTCGTPVRARRRRVDLADVVADLVRPQLRQLRALPDAGRAAIARQRARGAARDDEVERLDQRRRHAARALPSGRRPAGAACGHTHRDRGLRRGGCPMSGMPRPRRASRSSRSSVVTPSPSAS